MIQSISVANVATFHPTNPEVLGSLKQFNYIFGSNGTGKTTLSRVIADTTFSPTGQCTWKDGRQLDTLVLNRDFVKKNFDQLKGVFTLGEKAKDTEAKINAAKVQLDQENQSLANLKQTLGDDEGNGGKKGKLAELESDCRAKFWVPIEKIKKDKKLDGALKGILNDKEKCKQKLLQEATDNKAELKDLADLQKRAETIFGEAPTTQIAYPAIDATALLAQESNPILGKKVIGKRDVDIGAMIARLGNSDWVRQGVPYYEKNNGICPFCQRETSEQYAQSLRDYFDETFEQDTKAIKALIAQYVQEATAIQSTLDEIISSPGKFMNVEKLKTEKAALDQTIAANKLRLDNKMKEPSQAVALDSVNAPLKAIKQMIDAANAELAKHNATVDNLGTEKTKLTAEVWRYVLNELDVDLKQYREKKDTFDKAIMGLKTSIKEGEDRIASKNKEIHDLEKQTTSIQPTINAINYTLKQFGFDSFTLADAGDGMRYKLIRANGDDAKRTLSEGERTFVVFLYFYHLLKGSFSETGVTTDRIVVFDDPVSSLDSDVLFIVSSLIREVCENCRGNLGNIKQVFVLTHNVYFHKEVTFDKRPAANRPKDETFWILRKPGLHSECTRHESNPIKTSYELLWADVRDAEQALQNSQAVNPRIENALRRILEHYFTILGSSDYTMICDKFEGQDKHRCKSLFSWVNAGSHSALDDAYITPSDAMTNNALRVFKEIFQKCDHFAHYEMMNPPRPIPGAAVL